MTVTTPDIIQTSFVLLLVLLVGYLLWRKLHENEELKYEFLTIITHKFRTPMTRVKWIIADLLQSETDPYRKESLTELERSNEDLVKLVGALIEVTDAPGSARSLYKFERINLVDLVKEVFKLSDRSFKEKNISIELDFPDPDISVKADRPRLEFALSSIIENAYRYTPVGKKVWISVEAKWGKAIVSVSDNGIGISPLDMRNIGTKFFRSKNARTMDTEGFGVNLFLARSIVRRLHGKIDIYSPGLDQGSAFKVILPKARRIKK